MRFLQRVRRTQKSVVEVSVEIATAFDHVLDHVSDELLECRLGLHCVLIGFFDVPKAVKISEYDSC